MKRFFALLLLVYAGNACCQEKDTHQQNSTNESSISLEDRIKNYQTLITSLWLNHPDSALIYARQLLRLTEHESDAGHAVAIRLLGGVHLYKGNYDSALICSKLAYDLSVRTKDSVLISSSLNNIGFTQYHFGNYSRALETLLKALDMKYKVHNNYGLAQTINNIGLVYSKLKDYQKAREYFDKALTISENLRDNNQRLYSLNNIGYTYLNELNYSQAEKYFMRALDVSRNISNNNWLATTYSGLGQVRLRTKDVKQATRLFNISLSLRKEISDLNGMSEIYYLLSQVDATENHFDSAFKKLRKSQVIADRIGSKNRQLENYEQFKSLFVTSHQVDSALHYQNLFFELKERLFNERSARELADIQIKLLEEQSASLLSERDARLQRRYQVIMILVVIVLFSSILGVSFYYNFERKKKLSIDLLDKNQKIISQNKEINKQRQALMIANSELARAKSQIDMQHDLVQELNKKLQVTVDLRTQQLETVNEELKYSNLELDNFIYRSSHDLRGPLIRLTGICQVAMLDVQDEKAREYLTLIQSTAQHLNDLFDRLKAVSEINSIDLRKDMTDIPLLNLVARVKSKLAKIDAYNSIHFMERIDADVTYRSNEFILETIFYGLMENAIKFQKAGNTGENFVKVKVLKTRKQLIAVFIDNGIGINESHIEHLFQMFTIAARERKSIGMGLYIVKSAVEKLGGSIEFSKSKSGYTRFKVVLPVVD